MAEVARPTVAEPAPTRADGPPAPPAVAAWRVGDVIDGTYEVRRVFTAGAMGLVYHVRHLGWGLDLALKQPRAEFFHTDAQRADFEREAEAWADLGLHPNVVTCHYVRRIADVPCVFAEYAAGGSLADRLRDGPLPPLLAVDAAIQIAWGLDHAHSRGLIHQDVKPANLLVAGKLIPTHGDACPTVAESADGAGLLSVKVTDFGLAAARAKVESTSRPRLPGQTLAVAGAGLFTPEYAAPEQFAGESLTRRTDIWSWAVTLLELLTGRRPAVGPAAPDLLVVVDRGDWPRGLFELLAECLAVAPEQRPRAMADVAERLADVYRRRTGTDYPRQPPRPARLDLDAKNNRAVSLADLGKPDEAETLWAEVVRAERDHPEAGYNLGLARWRAGRKSFEELVGDSREVSAAFPDDPRPAVFAARVHLESGNVEDATAELGDSPDGPEADGVRQAIRTQAAQIPRKVWQATDAVEVTDIVWAGDRHVVTAGRDRMLRVYDADTGRSRHVLRGHRGIPDRLVASADGRYVLSGGFSEDPTGAADLFLWDVTSGALVWEAGRKSPTLIPLVTDGDLVLAFNGSTLIGWASGKPAFEIADAGHAAYAGGVIVTTAGNDKQLLARMWDLPAPVPASAFEIPAAVRDLEVSPDGRYLCGRVQGRLRHWDLRDGAESPGPVPGASGFVVTRGGPIEYTDHLLTVRQAVTDRPVVVFAPHGPNSGLVVALGTGGRVATGWEQGVAVWQLDPDARPYTAPPAVCVARRSETVIAAEEACDAELTAARSAMGRGEWASAAGHVRAARRQPGADRRADALELWRELSDHLSPGAFRRGWWGDSFPAPGVRDLAMTSDGRRVVVSRHLGFSVWDGTDGRLLAETNAPAGRTVAVSPDGGIAYTATGVAGRNLWLTATDIATGRANWSAELPPLTVGFGELRLSGDGRTLFSVHGDHSVRQWDADSGELRKTYTQRLGGTSALAPADDGSWFAVVGMGDGAVRVIDSETGRCRRTLLRRGASCVAVSGRRVAIGRVPDEGPVGGMKPLSAEEVLTVWDAVTGERMRSFKGPLAGASCVAASNDGGLLVAGYKHVAAAWDLEAGEFLRVFPAHGDEVQAVAAGNGRRVVATAAGESVRLWTLDWELTDRAAAPVSPPETVAWDGTDDSFALAVSTPGEPSAAAVPPTESVSLGLAKLVLTADGLYCGKLGGPLELLHRLPDITGAELRHRNNLGAALLFGGSLVTAVVGCREWDGWLAWGAAIGGGVAALLAVAAWRFPLLRVATVGGTGEYELRDRAGDTAAFVASLKLAAGVTDAVH